MESGSQGTSPPLAPSRRQAVWDFFVAHTPSCANASEGGTFPCVRSVASTAELLTSWEEAAAYFPELVLFVPVLDGPNGLIPDMPSKLLSAGHFSKIPFIAGAVLDEGTEYVPQTISNDTQLVEYLIEAGDPFATNVSERFEQDIATLLQLYPNNPALGSPYGTGNETFGLSSEYKRAAAMLGDVSFQAPRREWIQAATAVGVTTNGYIFTDQNAAAANPVKGGTYSFCSGSP